VNDAKHDHTVDRNSINDAILAEQLFTIVNAKFGGLGNYRVCPRHRFKARHELLNPDLPSRGGRRIVGRDVGDALRDLSPWAAAVSSTRYFFGTTPLCKEFTGRDCAARPNVFLSLRQKPRKVRELHPLLKSSGIHQHHVGLALVRNDYWASGLTSLFQESSRLRLEFGQPANVFGETNRHGVLLLLFSGS
jgi:hypothetical protein